MVIILRYMAPNSAELSARSEIQSGVETFQVDGADIFIEATKRVRIKGMPLVILLTGNAAVGKSTGAIIAQQILSSEQYGRRLSVRSPSSPNYQELLERGIIDTDFFFPPRGSEERRIRPFPLWFRRDEFEATIRNMADAIKNNQTSITLQNIYDRESGILTPTDWAFQFPIFHLVIVTGMYAFDCIPILQQYGIPTLRILVVAEKEKRIKRFLKRNKNRFNSEESIMDHLNDEVDPLWQQIQEKHPNYDLLWESNEDIIISLHNQGDIPATKNPLNARS